MHMRYEKVSFAAVIVSLLLIAMVLLGCSDSSSGSPLNRTTEAQTLDANFYLRLTLTAQVPTLTAEALPTPDALVIQLEIQELAEVELYEAAIDLTITVIDTGAAPDAELTLTALGTVTAGIDLSQFSQDDITVQPDRSLLITLPATQLTGCYLDQPEYDISCTDIPFVQDCSAIVDRMQDEAYNRAIDELRETAYDLEVLSSADQEAEDVVLSLLESLGYTRVTFQHSAGELPADSTCFSD